MELTLSDFNHSLDIQIRFNDVDGYRHVNNSIVQEYYDLGRMAYLIDVLKFDYKHVDNESLVIVSIKTDFIQPVYINDQIKVYTKVYQIGEKSIRMIQWLVKKEDKAPSVTCDSVLSGFDPIKETSILITEKWKKMMLDFEKNILIKK